MCSSIQTQTSCNRMPSLVQRQCYLVIVDFHILYWWCFWKQLRQSTSLFQCLSAWWSHTVQLKSSINHCTTELLEVSKFLCWWTKCQGRISTWELLWSWSRILLLLRLWQQLKTCNKLWPKGTDNTLWWTTQVKWLVLYPLISWLCFCKIKLGTIERLRVMTPIKVITLTQISMETLTRHKCN